MQCSFCENFPAADLLLLRQLLASHSWQQPHTLHQRSVAVHHVSEESWEEITKLWRVVTTQGWENGTHAIARTCISLRNNVSIYRHLQHNKYKIRFKLIGWAPSVMSRVWIACATCITENDTIHVKLIYDNWSNIFIVVDAGSCRSSDSEGSIAIDEPTTADTCDEISNFMGSILFLYGRSYISRYNRWYPMNGINKW